MPFQFPRHQLVKSLPTAVLVVVVGFGILGVTRGRDLHVTFYSQIHEPINFTAFSSRQTNIY